MTLFKLFSKAVAVVALLTASWVVNADGAIRSGSFSGLNNHITEGMVKVVVKGDMAVIELGADFSFDGAPDPKVALGKNGQYDPATLIEPLRSNSGAQTYQVPASINVGDYNEVYIWCEKFSVGLGVAAIQ